MNNNLFCSPDLKVKHIREPIETIMRMKNPEAACLLLCCSGPIAETINIATDAAVQAINKANSLTSFLISRLASEDLTRISAAASEKAVRLKARAAAYVDENQEGKGLKAQLATSVAVESTIGLICVATAI